MNQDWYKINRK